MIVAFFSYSIPVAMGTLAHSRNVSIYILQVFGLCQVFSFSKPELIKMGLNQIREI